MRDDLRQEEIRVDVGVQQEVAPADRDRRSDWPIRRAPAPDDAARISWRSCHACSSDRGRPDVLVAAEHHQRRKTVVHDLIGVRQAELDRVLRGQERDDAIARDVVAEIGDEVAEVVFLLRADGAIGDHDAHVVARQRSDRVVECRSTRPCLRPIRAPPAAAGARRRRRWSTRREQREVGGQRGELQADACLLRPSACSRPAAVKQVVRPARRCPPTAPSSSSRCCPSSRSCAAIGPSPVILIVHLRLVRDAAGRGQLAIHLRHRLGLSRLRPWPRADR